MEKTKVANPKVHCGTCRFFDGTTWCRHWNFFTTADSPPCRFYRAPSGGSSEISQRMATRRAGSSPRNDS